jgi:hypothetical protein
MRGAHPRLDVAAKTVTQEEIAGRMIAHQLQHVCAGAGQDHIRDRLVGIEVPLAEPLAEYRPRQVVKLLGADHDTQVAQVEPARAHGRGGSNRPAAAGTESARMQAASCPREPVETQSSPRAVRTASPGRRARAVSCEQGSVSNREDRQGRNAGQEIRNVTVTPGHYAAEHHHHPGAQNGRRERAFPAQRHPE